MNSPGTSLIAAATPTSRALRPPGVGRDHVGHTEGHEQDVDLPVAEMVEDRSRQQCNANQAGPRQSVPRNDTSIAPVNATLTHHVIDTIVAIRPQLADQDLWRG